MYCHNCGSKADEGAKFCSKCGIQLEAVSAPLREAITPHQAPEIQLPDPGARTKVGLTTGKAVAFWLMWSVLAVLSLIMGLNNLSYIHIGVFVTTLAILALFRNTLFRRVLPSILMWTIAYVVFFVAVSTITVAGSAEREKDIAQIQRAFQDKDLTTITEYLHPESRDYLREVFETHKEELDKIDKLISTKKLIYGDEYYSEYEVSDGGKKYVMVFEKVGGKWRLSRF